MACAANLILHSLNAAIALLEVAARAIEGNNLFPGCISDRGCYQSDPHILGEKYACVIGKYSAVRNSKSQFAAPYLAHTDLISHALDVWLYVSSELDLADADGAAFAR